MIFKTKIIFISGMNTNSSTGEFSQIKLFIESFNDEFEYKIFIRKSEHFHFTESVTYFSLEEELKDQISSLNPDIIILSEFQHLSKEFIDYLYSKDIVICTMDCSSLSKRMYNPPERTIYLKNCPLNNPLKNTKNEKYWFFAKKNNYVLNRKVLENRFYLKDNSKIVFISVAPWQYQMSKDKGIESFYSYLINLLIRSLLSEDKELCLFFIYPIKEFHNIVIEKDKVKVLFFEVLDNENYNNILYNSDLVISDNITQVSMLKAFINGINTLSLINTSDLNIFNLFKFNTFPYDYDFLKELYELEYCQLINKVEIFDETQVMQKIKYLLNNKDNKHINYIEKCNNLKTPKQLIEEIVLENIPSKM